MIGARRYRLPYSTSFLEFRLPPEISVDVAEAIQSMPANDPQGAIREALADPVGTAPLRQLARSGDRVCIVFTDSTRSCPDHLLVPALLAELEEAGVRDENITLLCATGIHRPSTPAEKIAKLGASVVGRYRVIDHEARNPAALVNLGRSSSGILVQVHRAAAEADLLLSTGVVEPHQYAGYSGGSKTLAVGAAGEALIAHTHGPAYIDDENTRLGRVEGNPFHAAVVEAAQRAGLRFILNVVLDAEHRILRAAAGDPEQAYQRLVAFARSIYEAPIPRQYDIVIGGVGHPKDANLYQASRAASYLYFAPTPVVRPGGFIIIPARCEEGAGDGVGEQRFFTAMRDAPDIQSILDDARRNGYPPGQQRAFVIARVLENARVIIVGSQYPEIVAACKMMPAVSMDEALALATREIGVSCTALVVPHAMLTLPVVQPESPDQPGLL
jgi:nickel-dependent lactate racemase